MEAKKIYEGFISFEERSAELYLDLSVVFYDRPQLRWFWVDMAMEEKQHAGLLQHCREAGVFASELPCAVQIHKLNSLFRELEARIAMPNLSVDDAFDVAIQLESSEINDIYSRLTAPIEGPAHVMRKKMELSLGSHFERLHNAAGVFGASPQIQTRLSNLLASSGSPHQHA